MVPHTWQSFADGLAAAIYDDDIFPLYRNILATRERLITMNSDLSRSAVTCADSPPLDVSDPRTNPSAEDLVEEGYYVLKNLSPRFGVSGSVSERDGGCQFWKYVGGDVERYHGPWNKTLSNKILIISNTVRLPFLLWPSFHILNDRSRPTREQLSYL